MVESNDTKFIVGLGNPGTRYTWTRHNVGFLTLDAFAAAADAGPPKESHRATYVEGRWKAKPLLLIKPQTYMNRSGDAVRSLLAAWAPSLLAPREDAENAEDAENLETAENAGADLRSRVLVVSDDLDLPLGKLRFRARGSAGGHRGVDSVIAELETERFSRLRVGIGREGSVAEGGSDSGRGARREAEDFVLEPLDARHRDDLTAVARHAAATLPLWLEEGVDACAQRFNGAAGECDRTYEAQQRAPADGLES